MEKFDRTFAIETAIDYVNAVLADYLEYFRKNNIDMKNKDNPLVRICDELFDIEYNKIYECKTAEDFENLNKIIKKGREAINEA